MRAGRCGDGHRVDVVAREQIVEVTDKDRIDGVGRCPAASRIVVPDGDKLGIRVLVYLRRVLGCMYVPESQDRNVDRVGHGQSFLEGSSGLPRWQRLLHRICQAWWSGRPGQSVRAARRHVRRYSPGTTQ